ncbi:low-density lipoprotein receptor-like [Amphibalanus amphitrite]|uniref:low-density lipoprotein receptor-like n=1 Tax=Amphibalanus amphitrite TaxID=1232801 RepID=UPI001C8FB482|nr:low-density lipoprotein receptor-like [Amphibalanus amphitrite]
MEPQCVSRPTPHVLPPCRHFCQDIVSSCGAAIPSSLSRNRAFNCSLMPDSTDPSVCYSSAADGCVLSEFACADQTSCLPAEWRCDGTPQCDDDSDELGCDGCSPLQYRCRPAGGCVDRTQLCDGFADCTEGDDERDCLQKDKEFASASSSAEHQT